MVDRDKIEGLFRHLEQYTTYLQEIVGQDLHEFLTDPKSIGSARYYLQVSIETCINIANHLVATERLRAPRDYRDSFKVLNETGILPDDFTRRMQELAGLRNLLVHVYWDVDDQMVYEGIRGELGDLDLRRPYHGLSRPNRPRRLVTVRVSRGGGLSPVLCCVRRTPHQAATVALFRHTIDCSGNPLVPYMP